MSNVPPSGNESPPSTPNDLAEIFMAHGMMPAPAAAGDLPDKGSLRRKLLVAVVIAAIGVGASIMSCVGQSFSYRQAHALEGIEHELKEIRASCSAGAPIPARSAERVEPR